MKRNDATAWRTPHGGIAVVVILPLLLLCECGRPRERSEIDTSSEVCGDAALLATLTSEYLISQKKWPESLEALREWARVFEGDAFRESRFLDPWGTPYSLRREADGRFNVVSRGPDGIAGTQDDIETTALDSGPPPR